MTYSDKQIDTGDWRYAGDTDTAATKARAFVLGTSFSPKSNSTIGWCYIICSTLGKLLLWLLIALSEVMAGTNTLAYFVVASVSKKKNSILTLTLVACGLWHSSSLRYGTNYSCKWFCRWGPRSIYHFCQAIKTKKKKESHLNYFYFDYKLRRGFEKFGKIIIGQLHLHSNNPYRPYLQILGLDGNIW